MSNNVVFRIWKKRIKKIVTETDKTKIKNHLKNFSKILLVMG